MCKSIVLCISYTVVLKFCSRLTNASTAKNIKVTGSTKKIILFVEFLYWLSVSLFPVIEIVVSFLAVAIVIIKNIRKCVQHMVVVETSVSRDLMLTC